MTALRVAVALLLLGLCVLNGRARARKLQMRSKALGDMLAFTRQLEVLIRANGRPIPDALHTCSRRLQGAWTGKLAETLSGLYGAKAASPGLWRKAFEALPGDIEEAAALSRDDVQLLSLFGDQLASSDMRAIAENYSLLYRSLEESLRASDRDRATKGKLYNTVGILVGLAAAIVVI